jgi:hypothetical protein
VRIETLIATANKWKENTGNPIRNRIIFRSGKQANRLKHKLFRPFDMGDPFVCCSTLSKWILPQRPQTVSVTLPEWWNPGGAKEENE